MLEDDDGDPVAIHSTSTRVLALDLATKTGYAVMSHEESDVRLLEFGLLKLDRPAKDMGEYPWNYIHASKEMADKLTRLVETHQADVIVLEELNLGRDRYIQKLLNWLHQALLLRLEPGVLSVPVFYLSSSEWRQALGLQLSKEESKGNRKLSAEKKRLTEVAWAKAEASGVKLTKAVKADIGKAALKQLDKKALGVAGKVTAKHLSVAWANERFNLALKTGQHDVADAICLGAAFCSGARPDYES